MDYYDDRDGRRRRVWALLGTAAYFGACALLMFRTLDVWVPDPLKDAIIVTFEPSSIRAGAEQTAPEEIAGGQTPEQAMTTEREDAPELPVAETGNETPEPTPDPEPQVNRRALFPGNAAAGSSASSGSGGGVSSGTGFSLDGRSLVGALPRPAYDVDVEGRVVMRITVNGEGRVTGAVFEQQGSTTNHSVLVAAARAAAMRARFTASEAEIQTGTITYIFTLN